MAEHNRIDCDPRIIQTNRFAEFVTVCVVHTPPIIAKKRKAICCEKVPDWWINWMTSFFDRNESWSSSEYWGYTFLLRQLRDLNKPF